MGVATMCRVPRRVARDRWSRTAVIRTAVIIGQRFCSLVASGRPGDHIEKASSCASVHRHHRLLRRLPIIRRRGDGLDPVGRVDCMCGAVAASFRHGAGPLLAVIVFATVGDHWREGSSRSSSPAARVFFFCRPRALALSEKQTLGDLSRPLLAENSGDDRAATTN